MTYVRNAWYVAAWADECGAQRPMGVRVLNEPIVIWRNAGGELAAFEDRCIHRLAPLSLGRCEGEKLRCMYHGLLYDRTGCVIEVPGQDKIPSSLHVRSYPVIERHKWIWIWMGGVSQANETLIPSVIPPIGLEHPDYIYGHGYLDFAAEARLINDNLLDLSHVSFLHAESFRLGETWTRERPQVTQLERSVRSERWFKNQGFNGSLDFKIPVDTYFVQELFIPGVLLMTARSYSGGTADALNGQQPSDFRRPPESSSTQYSFSIQAVTPLTCKTARYFYIVGDRRRGDETSYDMTTYEKGFAEDKMMIEAQQRNIDTAPSRRFMPTSADRGVVLFNRLIERMAGEEGRSGESITSDGPPHGSDKKESDCIDEGDCR